MCEIIGLDVEWNNGVANEAVIHVIVDDLQSISYNVDNYEVTGIKPSNDNNGSTNNTKVYYQLRDNGIVNVYVDNGSGQGMSGRTININMKDGSSVELVGPLNSNAEALNNCTVSLPTLNHVYVRGEKTSKGITEITSRFMVKDKLIELIKEYLPELQFNYEFAKGISITIPKLQKLNINRKHYYREMEM